MPSRMPALSLALLLAASAGAEEKAKVANFLPFDLAVCFLGPGSVEAPITDTALNGLWILARPLVLECLADTRQHLPGKSAAFKITFTVTDAGYSRAIETDGLTAAGKKCIDDALGKVTPPIAALPAGSKPVTFSEAVPELGATQQVRFGINNFSDITATVRLAMPSLCSCFASFKDGPDPAPMGLKLQLTRAPDRFKQPDGGVPKPVEVTVADGPAPVKACVSEKLGALSYPNTSDDQIVVPYEFDYLNAVASSTDVSALPDWLKFAQFDAMSAPRAAISQLELAKKVAAAARYNALVEQYQKLAKTEPKKAKAMLKDLVSTCKAMLAQDDVHLAALQSEAQLSHDALSLASSLKVKDPAWANAETVAGKAAAEADARVAKARELRTGDEKVCPKVHLD